MYLLSHVRVQLMKWSRLFRGQSQGSSLSFFGHNKDKVVQVFSGIGKRTVVEDGISHCGIPAVIYKPLLSSQALFIISS